MKERAKDILFFGFSATWIAACSYVIAMTR